MIMEPGSSQQELMRSDLTTALDKKEKTNSLYKQGNALYEKYKSAEYEPKLVLSVIKEVYDKNKFKPEIKFDKFIESFGAGLVKLCQQKLADLKYDLGKYGKKKDGVDGILGKMTNAALLLYTNEELGGAAVNQPPASGQASLFAEKIPVMTKKPKGASLPPKLSSKKAKTIAPETTEKRPLPVLGVDIARLREPKYKPGGKELATYAVKDQVAEIYSPRETTVTLDNLTRDFGERKEFGPPFLITEDPLVGGPITFLGKNIQHGIHAALLPLLKAVEKEIMDQGLGYRPAEINGLQRRNMSFIQKNSAGSLSSKLSDNTPSFHAWGLAIDIDHGANDPSHGRGNIPDQVVLAFAKFGFLWGGYGNPGVPPFLGRDPMHFQLRFLPSDPAYRAACDASPEAGRYLEKIAPILARMRG